MFLPIKLPSNKSSTIKDCGRYFIRQSISSAKDILSLVKSFLKPNSSYFEATIQALEDCQILADLNFLNSSQADDLQTLLSAALTNQETCSDGLQVVASDPSVTNGVLDHLSNGTMLYSISLALCKPGWVAKTKGERLLTERKLIFSDVENAKYNLLPRMSNPDEETNESITGGKLFQTTPGNVSVSQRVVVNQDGSGNFTTINDAVAAAPNNTAVVGQGFVAVNMTFRNTAGAIKAQAVAVRNGADLSTFYQYSFEGYQDTLYTHSLRQFYRECDIYGTVDFIFGNAAVVFQDCNIYRRLPLQGQFNAITAQGRTDPNQNTGTSIHNCSIRPADGLASSNGTTKTYLGRPWKEYSRTVYMQSFMNSLIEPSGWHEWSGTFALSTLYYAEYNNTGPGSNTSNRVTWPGYNVINVTDAVNFIVSKFVQGDSWLPATGVPYTDGLL
ncbi:hypothetical protein ACB092_03G037800 [Castanea dentata]